jgi:hypothetical protein
MGEALPIMQRMQAAFPSLLRKNHQLEPPPFSNGGPHAKKMRFSLVEPHPHRQVHQVKILTTLALSLLTLSLISCATPGPNTIDVNPDMRQAIDSQPPAGFGM